MAIVNSSNITYSPQSVLRPRESSTAEQDNAPGIGEQVNSAIKKVDELQRNADEMIEQVASGNVEDAHKAVIAMERALMAMDFSLQVRNKVLDAYQEIMRMQI